MKAEDLPDEQLVSYYWATRNRATDLDGQAKALWEESEEIEGMLSARGFRRTFKGGHEWIKP